jgi:hypothetical protein
LTLLSRDDAGSRGCRTGPGYRTWKTPVHVPEMFSPNASAPGDLCGGSGAAGRQTRCRLPTVSQTLDVVTGPKRSPRRMLPFLRLAWWPKLAVNCREVYCEANLIRGTGR